MSLLESIGKQEYYSQGAACFRKVTYDTHQREDRITTHNFLARIQANSLEKQLEHLQKPKFLIKINKTLQNAFPSNFFSQSTTNKSQSIKKSNPSHQNCLKMKLESILPLNKNQITPKNPKPSLQRYHSIQFPKPTFQPVLAQPITQTCQFKSSRQLSTLIQSCENKLDSSLSFEKLKQMDSEILPKTASTLENVDEEELFNITFGNGWLKTNERNIEEKNQQKEKVLKNQKTFGLRTALSLELKRNTFKKQLLQKPDSIKNLAKPLLTKDRGIPHKERKSIIQSTKRQLFSNNFTEQDPSQNVFLKMKIEVDEVIKKKTLILPKMGNTSKKERLGKLMRFVF